MIVTVQPSSRRVAASRSTRTSFVQALRTYMTTRRPLPGASARGMAVAVTTGAR